MQIYVTIAAVVSTNDTVEQLCAMIFSISTGTYKSDVQIQRPLKDNKYLSQLQRESSDGVIQTSK